VEHLAALRAIPNLVVIRPADANETSIAWKAAIERKGGPTLIALTRQAVPTLDRSKYATAEGLLNGAYVLADLGGSEAEILLMASGSEVQLVVAAAERLAEENYCVRVVSFPSWELFNATTPEYQRKVLPEGVRKRVAVEMGVAMGWEKYVGEDGVVLSIEGYGASAPYQTILQEYGFTVENVYQQAKQLLDQKR
jgi:transketolase